VINDFLLTWKKKGMEELRLQEDNQTGATGVYFLSFATPSFLQTSSVSG
jgi:hypothetical protein